MSNINVFDLTTGEMVSVDGGRISLTCWAAGFVIVAGTLTADFLAVASGIWFASEYC